MNKYVYVDRNLLDEPEKYFFSEYKGEEFVKSYFISRKESLPSLKKNSINYDDLFKEYVDGLKIEELSRNTIETKKVLSNILKKSIDFKNKNIDEKKYLNVLISKFEVSKKIYSEYDLDFKPMNIEYKDIENYCMLSYICMNEYLKEKNLKYLNVAIKINDLLCSLKERLSDNLLFFKNTVINIELEIIKSIFIKEGIRYDFM